MAVVALAADAAADAVDVSAGLTPDGTTVTLSSTNLSGVLSFACAEAATGTTLNYVLAGTDAASFNLASATATVTVGDALAAVAAPPLTITSAASSDVSGAQKTTVTGLCPAVGSGYLMVEYVATEVYETAHTHAHTMHATWDAVQAAFNGLAAAGAEVEQGCFSAVTNAEEAMSCDFLTRSLGNYEASLYC